MSDNPVTVLSRILHARRRPFVSGLSANQVGNVVRPTVGLFTGRSVHLGS